MSGETTEGPSPLATNSESEIKQILGLFDTPSFVRRGHDLEYALARLRHRLGLERESRLDMVRLRLRQWAAAATGPDDWAGVFTGPLGPLWDLAGAGGGGGPAEWAALPAPPRRRAGVAADLVASVSRFNRRWTEFLDRLTFESVNRQIDQYNRYYVLEKECVLGSTRLAARHFVPKPPMTRERLLVEFPELPVPGLAAGG